MTTPDIAGWRDIATAPRDGTMLLVGYDEGVAREGAMEDRQRVFEARWNDVQGTWSARNGFLLHSDATHWQPLPHPPSAHPAPIKPSGDTGELRERVAQIIEAAIERHNPGNSLRHTINDADAILDLIQSERGKAVPMTAQDLADHAADAFDNALPDDALPHEVGRAWKAVGERLAAILAERAEE